MPSSSFVKLAVFAGDLLVSSNSMMEVLSASSNKGCVVWREYMGVLCPLIGRFSIYMATKKTTHEMKTESSCDCETLYRLGQKDLMTDSSGWCGLQMGKVWIQQRAHKLLCCLIILEWASQTPLIAQIVVYPPFMPL